MEAEQRGGGGAVVAAAAAIVVQRVVDLMDEFYLPPRHFTALLLDYSLGHLPAAFHYIHTKPRIQRCCGCPAGVKFLF